MKRIFPERRDFQFMKYKYVWFGVSGVLILVSIIALATLGLEFGVDFTGGTEISIKAKTGTELSDIRDVMAEFGFEDAKIQEGTGSVFIIRTSSLDEKQKTEVAEALEKKGVLEEVLQVNDVGPGWGAQVTRQAIIALAIFLVAMLIYISLRFEFKMAVCAIAALFHDIIITIGVYALVGRQVNPATLIAVLTILGYSLYDTIVVFDRIKENTDQLTRQSRKSYTESVNDSINQVLMRTINTSLTTLVPIVALLIFGGATLQDFAFALFIGVVAGTYSSIFFATPLLAMWKETEPKYKAFQQRVERKQARESRVSSGKAGGAEGAATAAGPKPKVGPASKGSRAARIAAAGKAGGTAAEKAAGSKPQLRSKTASPGARDTESGQGAKPEPKAKAGAAPAAKKAAAGGAGKGSSSSAKSRTKGPGAGKKKKKK